MKAKTKGAIVLLLVCMLLVQELESWRVRIRLRRVVRRIRRVLKPVCKWGCPRVCKWVTKGTVVRHACGFGCRKLCGRKKREAIDVGEHAHVTPLSTDFKFYDLNNDTFVTVYEIADSLGHFEIETDLYIAFNSTDVDADEKLTKEELFSSEAFYFSKEEL